LLSRFYGITDPAIQAYGGHVIDHAGDGVVAVFGAPVAFGNDGERAVRAAIELHGAAAQLVDGAGKPLQLHIGIASGEVVAAVMTGGAQPKYAVTGDAVNLAARLDAKAQAGETIISDALHATISHLVEADALGAVEVKGFDQPVRVWRVRAAQTSGAERRPFVGRHSELRQLTGALETAIESGAGVAICVRGEPGIGKTRLVDELRARAAARGYACHTGHVLDFGVGRGQDAIPVILKDLLQIDDRADEAARRSAVERGLREGRIEPEHEVHINDLLDLPQRAEMQAVFDAMDNATHTTRRRGGCHGRAARRTRTAAADCHRGHSLGIARFAAALRAVDDQRNAKRRGLRDDIAHRRRSAGQGMARIGARQPADDDRSGTVAR